MSAIPFVAGSPIMIAGPTGSGKTNFTYKLLKYNMFTETPSKILYCYGVHQPFFNEMKLDNIEWYEGVPSYQKLEEMNDSSNFKILILDDLMEKILRNVEMQNLFTKKCHHYHISVIFITQNVSAQGPCARSIALNTHILVLFANKRDESQASYLGKQLYPGYGHGFIEAYEDATSTPFGYLVVDCHPQSPREIKLRTHIFPGEDTICYLKKYHTTCCCPICNQDSKNDGRISTISLPPFV